MSIQQVWHPAEVSNVKCKDVTHKVNTDMPWKVHEFDGVEKIYEKKLPSGIEAEVQDELQYHESMIGHDDQYTFHPGANDDSMDYNSSES